MSKGRFFSSDEETNWGRVCVVGSKLRKELFQDAEPIGKYISIGSQQLLVIGEAVSKGRGFDGDGDTRMFLPITTMQKRMVGRDMVNVIFAEAADLTKMDMAKDQVWQLLMNRYNNITGFKH